MRSLVDRHEVEKLLVLAAALQTGLVDAIDDPAGRTPEQAAAAVEGEVHACRVLLDALTSIGVAEDLGGLFRLTAVGRLHLVEPPPGTTAPPELERSSLLHQAHKFQGWLRLPEVVAGRRTHSGVKEPGRLRSFVRTMGEGDPAVTEEVVTRCLVYAREAGDPSKPADMIDIGGAVGHMAREFARRGVRPTLFDRPDVLPEAREFLGADAEGVDMEEGDFTASLPLGPFDLAYLGNVFHIYGPGTLRSLTRRVFESLRPGGVICVRDYVWERSPRSAMFAVNMLQATAEGGVWREDQYRAWLAEAGFEDVRVIDLELSANQLILGRRTRG
ncbi:MAG: methyltransferase [Thermoleophilia bacterium]